MNIYDLVTSSNLKQFWEQSTNDRIPFFGESKFPNNKQIGLTLDWIKGAAKRPVILSLSAFDADVVPISRKGFQKLSTEMPFFKNEMIVDENLRQELNKLLQTKNERLYSPILKQIFRDNVALVDSAALTREAMRMQILTTGKVALESNGQAYTYDYGVPDSHKITPTTLWSATGADPIGDINNALDVIENDTGVRPSEILLNGTTLKYLTKCDAIKNVLKYTALATKKNVIALISEETKCDIYEYNKGYANDSGSFTKFIPDGKVVLMPANALGETMFGTTPEESDLMSQPDIANVEIVDTGVAITTTKQTDPVNVRTKVSQICLPSFERADQIAILSVTA